MHIRTYAEGDADGCAALLQSNVPAYFEAADEVEFRHFLAHLPGPYFVIEDEGGQIVACGGIALDADPEVAVLCWGIVDANRHRSGLGSAFLKHRLDAFLPAHPRVNRVRVNTTQKAQGFFERRGFAVTEVRKAVYGPDLDHVRMELSMMK